MVTITVDIVSTLGVGYPESRTIMLANKALHLPPVDSAHAVYHTSCNVIFVESHEVHQCPGASELRR